MTSRIRNKGVEYFPKRGKFYFRQILVTHIYQPMINKIILKEIATYSHEGIEIRDLSSVNFFYGLNGSGKSTIAKFVRNCDHPDYGLCKLEHDMGAAYPAKIRVYNDDFVRENFFESSDQSGVFSLGKDNIDAEREIQQSSLEIDRINTQICAIKENIEELDRNIEAAKNTFINDLFTIKQNHENRELDFCLTGAKKREGMLNKFIGIDYQESTDTFDLLEEEIKKIDDSIELKTQLADLAIDLDQIKIHETNSLWETSIVPNGESNLKELIDKLSNSKWIETGKLFLTHTDQCCPFCQQKLPTDFLSELEKIFDGTYKNQINEIDCLKKEYEQYKFIIKQYWDNNIEIQRLETKDTLKQSYESLVNLINENIILIENKIKNPKSTDKLNSTNEALKCYIENINLAQEEIASFNEKISNKQLVKNDIKERFWKLVRYNYQDQYVLYKNTKNENLNKKEPQIADLTNNNEELNRQINRKTVALSKISNTEQAVNNINTLLKEFGLSGFLLKKISDDPPKYRIVREKKEIDTLVYKSLSEGEKTIISFLYFLETCMGAEKEDDPHDLVSRIIVIDDPISSLSHNHLYDIASLIVIKILENESFGQIFILTHSLYFLNEFLKQIREKKRKHWKFFHVKKYNNISTIEEFNHNEIQNTYQAYWKILKDAKNGKIDKIAIPNTMRNILEYYFAFVRHQEGLNQILRKLNVSDIESRSFYRFLNRESHRDTINIDEFISYDIDRFFKCFEKIFIESNFQYHYQAMMGLAIEEGTE